MNINRTRANAVVRRYLNGEDTTGWTIRPVFSEQGKKLGIYGHENDPLLEDKDRLRFYYPEDDSQAGLVAGYQR